MTDQPKPAPMHAMQAVHHHLDAVYQIMAEANERSVTQIAALVVKAGGQVRLTFDEIAALDRQTHMLDVEVEKDGMMLTWKARPPAPPMAGPKKKGSVLVDMNGKPLNGGGL